MFARQYEYTEVSPAAPQNALEIAVSRMVGTVDKMAATASRALLPLASESWQALIYHRLIVGVIHALADLLDADVTIKQREPQPRLEWWEKDEFAS